MSIEYWSTEMDGKLSEKTLQKKLQSRGYAVSKYVYPPGTFFPPHTHSEDKIDAVLSGKFKMSMNGKFYVLEAGDCLAVPAGALHSAEVIGDEPVVSLDAIRL